MLNFLSFSYRIFSIVFSSAGLCGRGGDLLLFKRLRLLRLWPQAGNPTGVQLPRPFSL
jgi:hypothetical protein